MGGDTSETGNGQGVIPISCARWQEAISARLDQEDGGLEPELVEAHLRSCAHCRHYEARAGRARRLLRIRPVADVPDRSSHIAAMVRAGERAGMILYIRVALLVVAGQIVALSLPALWRTAGGHEGRHAFSFSVTYALALVLVAWRPGRVRTVLPISAALAVSLGVTAVVDGLRGNTAWLGELVHVPEFVSLGLLWLLMRSPPAALGPRRSIRPKVDRRRGQ